MPRKPLGVWHPFLMKGKTRMLISQNTMYEIPSSSQVGDQALENTGNPQRSDLERNRMTLSAKAPPPQRTLVPLGLMNSQALGIILSSKS